MTSYQIKTIRGKPFSVERYYMLSEIEQQSLLPVYLDEYPDDNDDQAAIRNRERSESNSTQQTVETEDSGELYRHIQLPEFAILYLLWDLGEGLDVFPPSNISLLSSNETFDDRNGPVSGIS